MSVCEGEEVWPEGVSLASGWHDGGSSLQGGQGTKGMRGGFLNKDNELSNEALWV